MRRLDGDADVVLLQDLFGTVARANHRSRDDLDETLVESLAPVGLEFLRRHVTFDWKVVRRRSQVLTQRQDVDAGVITSYSIHYTKLYEI